MISMTEQLETIPWEYAVTLTFTGKALRSLNSAQQADPSMIVYRDFVRRVATTTGLRIGAVSVVVWNSPEVRQHAHLLMTGRTSKTNRTLEDCSPSQLEKIWPHGIAKVKPITDIIGAVDYLAQNELSGGTGYNFHGQRLINGLLRAQLPVSIPMAASSGVC